MKKKKNFLYNLLVNSYFYNFSQLVMGATTFRKKYVESLKIKKKAKILDIGCGTGSIVSYLNNQEYYGYDINFHNIRFAKKKYGNKGIFKCKRFTNQEAKNLPKFNLIFLFGVIHHLNDFEVLRLLKILKKSLNKKNGVICSIDGVKEKKQSIIAKFFLDNDRGKFVRKKNEYISLIKKVFRSIKTNITHTKIMPYTYLTMKIK